MDGEAGALEAMEASPAATDFVAAHYVRPKWAEGAISPLDAAFLFDMLARTAPAVVVEVGVASGVSTAFLLHALASSDREAQLFAFDALDHYYGDRQIRVGQVAFDQHGESPARLQLFPGVPSTRAAFRLAAAGADAVDLAFIDANHNHPFACFDLLALLPVLKRGAWVVLHDIGLPEQHSYLPLHGPSYLFHQWPGRRRIVAAPGRKPNIGAIELLASVTETFDAVLGILDNPWDHADDVPKLGDLEQALRLVDRDRQARLQAICDRRFSLSEQAARAELERALAAERQKVQSLEAQLGAARQRVQAIEASTSWRVTAGLRAAGTVLGRLRPRR